MSPNVTAITGESTSLDLLGTPLDLAEDTLLNVYAKLKHLVSDDSLAPCVASNARVALSAVGVALTDLAVEFEPLTDLSC